MYQIERARLLEPALVRSGLVGEQLQLGRGHVPGAVQGLQLLLPRRQRGARLAQPPLDLRYLWTRVLRSSMAVLAREASASLGAQFGGGRNVSKDSLVHDT